MTSASDTQTTTAVTAPAVPGCGPASAETAAQTGTGSRPGAVSARPGRRRSPQRQHQPTADKPKDRDEQQHHQHRPVPRDTTSGTTGPLPHRRHRQDAPHRGGAASRRRLMPCRARVATQRYRDKGVVPPVRTRAGSAPRPKIAASDRRQSPPNSAVSAADHRPPTPRPWSREERHGRYVAGEDQRKHERCDYDDKTTEYGFFVDGLSVPDAAARRSSHAVPIIKAGHTR